MSLITKAFVCFSLALFAASSWADAKPFNMSSAQKKLIDQLARTTQPSDALLNKVTTQLSQEQLHNFLHAASDVKVTADLIRQVYQTAYHTEAPINQRGRKIKQLLGLGSGEVLERRVCIWDPIGKAGPIFQGAKDQKARVRAFGIKLNLVPYTDEGIATADLKSGHCDAALISGLRARSLNKYTGTTDAIGAITTKKQMHTLLYVLSRPTMANHMIQGPFVTLGIAQGGAAYVFVNDRSINTLSNAAGKKVAVLGYDPVQAEMVAQIGATPVPATMLSAPNMFNNGVVDVLAAPLVAYDAMELYKGMTPNGGIIDFPLAQITMQLIGWRSEIPNFLGQLVRESFFDNYKKISEALSGHSNIPDHWWIEIPPKDKVEYTQMMQKARITLRKKGYYSADMLTLQRKIRCKYHPSHSECTNPVE